LSVWLKSCGEDVLGNIPFGVNGIPGLWSDANAAADKTPKTTLAVCLRDYVLEKIKIGFASL
jgi:hypothetical protein